MKRDDVLRLLMAHKQELDSFGVKYLAIFGSVARDEARPDSDVDILVEFSKPVGMFEFLDLKNYLENLLGRRVDIGTAASLRPNMRARVLKEAVHVS